MRSHQNLAEQLFLQMRDKNIRTILITDGEGSLNTAIASANFGIHLAQKLSRMVLLIDADVRTSSLTKLFNLSTNHGLYNILEEKALFEDAIQYLEPNLFILPSGATALTSSILLDSSMMSKVLNKAKEQFGIILVNCPDLTTHSDSVILSAIIDGVILIINEGKEKRLALEGAIVTLRRKIIGGILSNRNYAIPQVIYKRI